MSILKAIFPKVIFLNDEAKEVYRDGYNRETEKRRKADEDLEMKRRKEELQNQADKADFE